jgi:hypothetical protein
MKTSKLQCKKIKSLVLEEQQTFSPDYAIYHYPVNKNSAALMSRHQFTLLLSQG